MSTEKIKELLGGLDLEAMLQKLLPEIEPLLDRSAAIARLIMMIGPFVVLAMGLYYFLNAPKEANYRAGYRCHWGMGSVEAWRYTQRLAGIVWSVLGLALAIWMAIAGGQLASLELLDAMGKVAVWIFWQAALLLLSRIVIDLLVFLRYDRKGVRRYTWAELWKG